MNDEPRRLAVLAAIQAESEANVRAIRGEAGPLGRPPDRRQLTVEAWLRRKLPPRDFLFDAVLSTICRWLIVGATGVGKTLLALELAFAIAAGANFLNWKGDGRKPRVMYFDGELPAETLKERIELASDPTAETSSSSPTTATSCVISASTCRPSILRRGRLGCGARSRHSSQTPSSPTASCA